ncbi:MAG: hypothetical protein OXF55_01210 [Caldilineaceae bacterium]|nr:hypothetical protein [Caldilineaceae bacterium]
MNNQSPVVLEMLFTRSTRQILSMCEVASNTETKWHEFLAVWDSGANVCAISHEVIDKCGLTPVGQMKVLLDGKIQHRPKYLISLSLAHGVEFCEVVAGDREDGDIKVLIGMNVIDQGDFLVLGKEAKAIFRYPSVADGGSGLFLNDTFAQS